jgi:UV DNA damage repair endonuclease
MHRVCNTKLRPELVTEKLKNTNCQVLVELLQNLLKHKIKLYTVIRKVIPLFGMTEYCFSSKKGPIIVPIYCRAMLVTK